jgi:predicted DNA binding CopG/RHH family protein
LAKRKSQTVDWAGYYDQAEILEEFLEDPVHFSLDEQLQKKILSGERAKRLKNITIKMDPLQIEMIRKLAVTKSIPYQTLIRHWLAEKIKSELDIRG